MGNAANALLEAALAYAAMGLPVFPCAPGRTRGARSRRVWTVAMTAKMSRRRSTWASGTVGFLPGQ